MSELDFRKKLILNEFKTMSKGKNNSELLPLILALSTKAKQAGIVFTKEDFDTIIEDMKPNMSEREKLILPEIMKMLGN